MKNTTKSGLIKFGLFALIVVAIVFITAHLLSENQKSLHSDSLQKISSIQTKTALKTNRSNRLSNDPEMISRRSNDVLFLNNKASGQVKKYNYKLVSTDRGVHNSSASASSKDSKTSIASVESKKLRNALKKGYPSSEFQALLVDMRKKGNAVLDAKPAGKHNAIRKKSNGVMRMEKISTQTLSVLPIKKGGSDHPDTCTRFNSKDELKEQLDNSLRTSSSENDLLLLAGKYAGINEWQSALEIYERLRETAQSQNVVQAAMQNIDIAKMKIDILNETDTSLKEDKEFKLAIKHQAYGHEKAAKSIYRHLADNAVDSVIRKKAQMYFTSKP